MLIDANLLLFAVDEHSPWHRAARGWVEESLNGPRRVGLPWQTLGAFLRVSTNPRAVEVPLQPDKAWGYVESWLGAPAAWIPQPTAAHADVLGSLIRSYLLRSNMVPDAQLAALAIEHGLTIFSADTDFARFTEIRWENPLSGRSGGRVGLSTAAAQLREERERR